MDNNDLPLIVAEMLIDIQHLKERVALLENTFREVRTDLSDIHGSVRDMHAGYQEQGSKLSSVLERITAIIQERNAPPDEPAGLETPLQ